MHIQRPDREKLMRMFDALPRYETVDSKLSLSERFAAIRRNYATYQREVDAGEASWLLGNPYDIADWINIFTPIEMAAWQDIRYFCLPLWPQFPVGKYFADFGNPVARVALECDGKDFHDPVKDAKRDREFAKMGWRVIRAPGSQCIKTMDTELEIRERGEDVPEGYSEYRDKMTLDGIMKRLRIEFRDLQDDERRHDQ